MNLCFVLLYLTLCVYLSNLLQCVFFDGCCFPWSLSSSSSLGSFTAIFNGTDFLFLDSASFPFSPCMMVVCFFFGSEPPMYLHPVSSLLRALPFMSNFSTGSAWVPSLSLQFEVHHHSEKPCCTILQLPHQHGGTWSRQQCCSDFFSCSSPSFGGTLITTRFRKFSGMLIWHRGWALTARMTQNVSSSHILASDNKFTKAAESWSVDKLSNKVITWSFTAGFCGGSFEKTC